MRVDLKLVGPAAFEASGQTSGASLIVDGSPAIGGEGRGLRPMELLLTSVASCSAMDVLRILRQQHEPLENLHVSVEGARADGNIAPFKAITLRFRAVGQGLDAHKVRRAIGLAVEKYCSARATLDPHVTVTWEVQIEEPELIHSAT